MTRRADKRLKRLPIPMLLLMASLLLPLGVVHAANKPPKPAPMLGSNQTKDAKAARGALLKQRSTTTPLKPVHPGKIANSLNRRPGKTLTVPRKLPK